MYYCSIDESKCGSLGLKITKGLFLIAIYAERNISKDAEGLLELVVEEFSMFNSTIFERNMLTYRYVLCRPILRYF